MKYFDKYVSNCAAGSGNQKFFCADPDEKMTSRAFYKITAGGEFDYSFLYSNTVDTTFADGSESTANRVCDEWHIHSMRAATVSHLDADKMPDGLEFVLLTFDGKKEKTVAPGELFETDAVRISARSGEYICIETVFSGNMIPYHHESLVPLFRLDGDLWVRNNQTPVPSMIGCDRPVKTRICFLGDSITQGIGTPVNSYTHYASLIADEIGKDYAVWDTALGYARASDAASDGIWLYKVRQSDIVSVCLGVNDLLQGASANEVTEALTKITVKLKKCGKTVILQTPPPFDYKDGLRTAWNRVCDFVMNDGKTLADGVFDVRPVLSLSESEPERAKFGGHPNSEGHTLWAKAYGEYIKEFTEKI